MSFALGVVGFAISLNVFWFYAGWLASPVLSWVAGWAVQKHDRPVASPSEK